MQQNADFFFSQARENQTYVFCPFIINMLAFLIMLFILSTGHTGRKKSAHFIHKERKHM